jgi:hypothetical protein
MQIDPCCHRPDRWQIDVVVGGDVGLIGLRKPSAAAVAGLGVDLAHLIGIRVERARHARPAFARRLGRIGTIGLLAARGRQRGIVGSFGRDVQLGFERGDASVQRQDQRDQFRLVEFAKRIGVHPEVESARGGRINPARPSQDVAQNARWG